MFNKAKNIIQSKRALLISFLLSACLYGIVQSSENFTNYKTTNNDFTPSIGWTAYKISEQASYSLSLEENDKSLQILIPLNSIQNIKGVSKANIFVPSQGEYLLELDNIELIKHPKVLSLKNNSKIYVIHSSFSKEPKLKIQKLV